MFVCEWKHIDVYIKSKKQTFERSKHLSYYNMRSILTE